MSARRSEPSPGLRQVTASRSSGGACLRRNQPGCYQIQAAIAAVHAAAGTYNHTDWPQIIAIDDQLQILRPDPITTLNWAVAIAELDGPAAVLAAPDTDDIDRLDDYQPYHATVADLLARNNQPDTAITAYDRAIALTTTATERSSSSTNAPPQQQTSD